MGIRPTHIEAQEQKVSKGPNKNSQNFSISDFRELIIINYFIHILYNNCYLLSYCRADAILYLKDVQIPGKDNFYLF